MANDATLLIAGHLSGGVLALTAMIQQFDAVVSTSCTPSVTFYCLLTQYTLRIYIHMYANDTHLTVGYRKYKL